MTTLIIRHGLHGYKRIALMRRTELCLIIITFNFLFLTLSFGDVTLNADSSLAAGYYTFDTLTINCTITCRGNTSTNTGVVISCTNLIINGKLSADSQGYNSNSGPGCAPPVGGYGVGGSYGGFGCWITYRGNVYGSIKNPTDLGSGGEIHDAAGSFGGGSITLIVTNELQLNGRISTNGWNGGGNNSGGSGGTVNIRTAIFSGAGQITANGGTGSNVWGGNGGGGRVAIYYETNTFTGTIVARRGTNNHWLSYGGCGTIFMKNPSQNNGVLILDNDTYTTQNYTPITGEFDTIVLRHKGYGQVLPDSTVTFANISSDSWWNVIGYDSGFLTITGLGTFPGSDFIIDGYTLENQNLNLIKANNLTIRQNSRLTHKPNIDGTKSYSLNLDISNNLTIDSGGYIEVDGRGYPAGYGPGKGAVAYGGSYGGFGETGSGGGAGVGPTNGSETEPTELGSGGNGFSGGGAVYMKVWNTLRVDGTISANGTRGTSGNGTGSGGSIWIKTQNWAGNSSGSLLAKGGYVGSGAWLGSGGGGRIAVYYVSKTFTGTVSVDSGGRNARAGTYYPLQTSFGPGTITLESYMYLSPIPRRKPTFSWTAPADGENDKLHFDLQVSQDSSFSSTPVISVSSDSSMAGFEYSPDNGISWYAMPAEGVASNGNPAVRLRYTLQEEIWEGVWYWRVRAKDVDGITGNDGEWSSVSFSIVGTLVVEITAPADSIAVYDEKIRVEGNIDQSVSQSIVVNGTSNALTLTDGKFSDEVGLAIGKNTIMAEGFGGMGNYMADTVTIYRLRVPSKETESSVGKDGGTIRIDDYDGYEENDAKIEIEKGTFDNDVKIKFTKTENDFPVYEIKINNQESYVLKKRIKINLSYMGMSVKSGEEDNLSIFYFDGVKWQPIGSEVNKERKLVSCYTTHASKYAVMHKTEKSAPVYVSPPVFTPNGDGINDYVTFNFTSGMGARIEIVIYDYQGRLTRIISEENFGNGISLNWDGLDSSGKLAETGLYIYNVSLSGKTISSGTVVLAK